MSGPRARDVPAREDGLRLVHLHDVPAQAWKNGGGVTRELLRVVAPGAEGATADAAWALRISVADIATDGPFSAFPGIDRHFAVLSGAGVRLHLPGQAPLDCRAGDPPLAFDGADAPGCALLDGATRDLNVMVDRRFGRATLARAHAGAPATAATTATGTATVTATATAGAPASVPAPAQATPRARGAYVGTPARLARAGHPDVALSAGTLAWLDDAREDDGPWTLLAADPDAGEARPLPPGPTATSAIAPWFWITYSASPPPR